MSVSAIVLAAGLGTRMVGLKQLLPLDGRPLLQHAVDAAAAAGLDEVIVVLGHRAGEVASALALPPGARAVVNPRFAEGQSTSLAAGLAAASPRSGAALILLGDQPAVRPAAIRALADAHRAGGPAILRAAYRGRPGHPVLLDRSVWAEAAALRGDQGARSLIAREAGRIGLVEVGGDPPQGIDTPNDLDRHGGRGRPG